MNENLMIILRLIEISSDVDDGWCEVSGGLWDAISTECKEWPDLIEIQDGNPCCIRIKDEAKVLLKWG